MSIRRGVLGVMVFLFGTTLARPALAVPFVAGDVLRVTFDVSSGLAGYPPTVSDGVGHSFAIPEEADVFGLGVFVASGSDVNSFTARLYDNDRLLGTSTIPAAPVITNPYGTFANFYFTSPGSLFTGGTAVDFTSFQNGTFDGAVEFSIDAGEVSLRRNYTYLFLGHAVSGREAYGFRIIPHGGLPTPEPASLLLIGSGLAGVVLRVRRRAR